jgi:hypothetical protein
MLLCVIRFEEKFFRGPTQNHPKFHHRRGSSEMNQGILNERLSKKILIHGTYYKFKVA